MISLLLHSLLTTAVGWCVLARIPGQRVFVENLVCAFLLGFTFESLVVSLALGLGFTLLPAVLLLYAVSALVLLKTPWLALPPWRNVLPRSA